MFSDLVDSTALAARMDPEDLREVIPAYQKCVAETVQRFGGFVAKYMGDGVLVYFGYPKAHGDDAKRAVRAGLAISEAVGKLSSVKSLQVRVGIGTGLVVVGDLIGGGAAQEQTVCWRDAESRGTPTGRGVAKLHRHRSNDTPLAG
jgi:class 3 adenylate cyclase